MSIFRFCFVKFVIKDLFSCHKHKQYSIQLFNKQSLFRNYFRLCSQTLTSNAIKPLSRHSTRVPEKYDNNILYDEVITPSDIATLRNEEGGILEPCEEDVSDISPFVSPSYNLAAYANKSFTLQQLIKLGVELHKIEKRKGAAESILKLDFERDIKNHLRFLNDVGVKADDFGQFITKNPFIFEVPLEDLQVRINYLEAKKFDSSSISRIITKNPKWLSFGTIEIDKRLGIFQRQFIMSGDEVRFVTTKRPQLITYDMTNVMKSLVAVKVDMGFTQVEAKQLLLDAPKIYNIQIQALKDRFDYVHNIMGIPHEQILQHPNILLFRNFIVKQRHEFLKELGRAQYNPKLPGYVSLDALKNGSDVDFCRDVARTSTDVFNTYLKSC